MPPKVKKIDPELQKAQFEEWKQKDEYKMWYELHVISKSLYDISETTFDLTGNWQIYHDKLMEVTQVFKVKTKLKEIQHMYIRSAYFATEDVDINKQIVKLYIDEVHYTVEKADRANANHIKQLFSKIFRTLEDHKFLELNPENYVAERKSFVTLLTDFYKKMPALIKSHKVIEEKLMLTTKPLRELLAINKRLMFFDLTNINKKDRLTKEFVLKADIDVYCVCLQECMRLLYQEGKPDIQLPDSPPEPRAIQFNPPVRLIFNKLAYEGWQNNKIEAFYLTPLQLAFDRMRHNLLCLMIKGQNYYKTPLRKNEEFVNDVKDVINAELIAEHLLGNPLRRDQLNFMYNVLQIIYNANPQSQQFLLKRDENCVRGSVPKLVVYQTILHMRRWKDRKQEDEIKLNKEKSKNLQTIPEESVPNLSQIMSPDKRKTDDTLLKQAVEAQQLADKQDLEKYGRYWLWDNYCSEPFKQMFEDCVEKIRHVNKAVQQDIEDEIIREGMIPKVKDRKIKQDEASQNFNELRKKDNSNNDVIQRRPPELWNFPQIVQEKHQFRAIADPKKCYVDGRIEELEAKIFELSAHLETFNAINWNELLTRVIDAQSDKYVKEVTVIDVQV